MAAADESGFKVGKSKRQKVMAALRAVDGLDIRVGYQGQTGYAEAHKQVLRRSGGAQGGGGRGAVGKRGRKLGINPPTGSSDRTEYPYDPSLRAGRTVVLVPSGLRIVDLATIQEFGSAKARIPARSWIRSTLSNNAAFLRKLRERMANAALRGEDPIPHALQIGIRLEAAMKKAITDLKDPPLAPYTKWKRWLVTGDTDPNPLIDTGQLRNAITSVVVQKGRRVGGIGL